MSDSRRFAGLPLGQWMFALRIWLAIHLALGVAFWIQLDGAESAGVIVGMLALQTRGQAFEKGVCCVLGTVVGGIMSIVIVALFAQARDLYVIAYSAWLAVCVFAAGFFDGNRAYGAVVCGYTVSIVAVMHIDDPTSVFSEIINRCAAITLGIASLTLVVDVLAGPDIGPALLNRIGRGMSQVRSFTDALRRQGPDAGTDARTATFLGAISNQHVPLNALPVEAVSGSTRAGAVRASLAAVIGELGAARALAVSERPQVQGRDPRLHDLIVRRLAGELFAMREAAAFAFAAAQAGQAVPHAPRMPIFRPWQSALCNALRAFVASVLTGFLFVLMGWSATDFSWAMTGVIICLSSNAPNPAAMTKGALIGLPTAVVLGGITKFLILGGVDAFPLLMIGTAPALLATLLLTGSANPALASGGLITTAFFIVAVGPSNPQSYDPQSYVVVSILLVIVALFAFFLVRLLFPTTDAQRRRWTLAAARRDLQTSLCGNGPARSEDESRFLDASRIGTLMGLKDAGSADREADLASLLRMADLARAARRVRRALDRLAVAATDADQRIKSLINDGRAALATASADHLRQVSTVLMNTGDDRHLTLAADMAWAADLIEVGRGGSTS